MLKCKIQILPRTVGSEAMNTIKLFVDNNSGSDTSTVCHTKKWTRRLTQHVTVYPSLRGPRLRKYSPLSPPTAVS